ncbi:zinc finger, C2H2 type [Ditylenchus destructor]|nr:zinc finger, C2H2 type [Ditylenchus destructor]
MNTTTPFVSYISSIVGNASAQAPTLASPGFSSEEIKAVFAKVLNESGLSLEQTEKFKHYLLNKLSHFAGNETIQASLASTVQEYQLLHLQDIPLHVWSVAVCGIIPVLLYRFASRNMKDKPLCHKILVYIGLACLYTFLLGASYFLVTEYLTTFGAANIVVFLVALTVSLLSVHRRLLCQLRSTRIQLCFPRQTVSVANFPAQFSLPLAFFQSPQPKLARPSSSETGKGLHNGLSTAHELSPSKKRSMSDSQSLEHVTENPGNGTHTGSVFSIPKSLSTKRRKMDSSSDSEPLDLSKKPSNTSKRNQLSPTLPGVSEQPAARTNKGGNSTTPQKKFHCDCGVSFVSADTLIAHKKFYCKNRTEEQEEELMPKLEKNKTELCKYCDFQAASHSQMMQHMRTYHVLNIDSFVCALCGYKGFSMRGMKNHVKLTHEMDSDSEKVNPVVKVEEP